MSHSDLGDHFKNRSKCNRTPTLGSMRTFLATIKKFVKLGGRRDGSGPTKNPLDCIHNAFQGNSDIFCKKLYVNWSSS